MSFERQKEIQAKKRQKACFTSFNRYTERYVRTLKLNEVKIPHLHYLAPNGQPLLSAFSPEVNEQSTICIARVFANVPFSRTLNIVQYITVLLNEKHNKTTARSRETELKKNLATSYCTYDRSGP